MACWEWLVTNLVIKLYNLETSVHVLHLSLYLHCSKSDLAPHSHWNWRNTSPYTYLTFHIHAINLSIKSQQGKRWAFASQCAKQPCSEGCGTHQLFHQLLLSRKCIYNIIPVQLQLMYNGLLSMTNIVIKLYNLETNVHVCHLSLYSN